METAFERLCRRRSANPDASGVSYSSTLPQADDRRRHSPSARGRSGRPTSGAGLTHVGPHRDDLVITLGRTRHPRYSARRASSARRRSFCACWRPRRLPSARDARRCFCSTIPSPSSTFVDRLGFWNGWRATDSARPFSRCRARADIPRELTRLERFRGRRPGRTVFSRVRWRMSDRKRKGRRRSGASSRAGWARAVSRSASNRPESSRSGQRSSARRSPR